MISVMFICMLIPYNETDVVYQYMHFMNDMFEIRMIAEIVNSLHTLLSNAQFLQLAIKTSVKGRLCRLTIFEI